ncbi:MULTISPECIES: hypothetical protein [Geobacillus]|nr:hypothetical protein [Geobacillus icigianus]
MKQVKALTIQDSCGLIPREASTEDKQGKHSLEGWEKNGCFF